MTLVASSNPSIDAGSAVIVPPVVTTAAEDIDALAPCGLDSSGEAIQSNGTLADAAGQFIGVAARAALTGQPVSLFGEGAQFEWTDLGTLVPGAPYFVGGDDGSIDDTATTGDTLGSFLAVTVNVLKVVRTRLIGGAG